MRKSLTIFAAVAACVVAATPVVASAQTWANWSTPASCPSTAMSGGIGSGSVNYSLSSGTFVGAMNASGAGCGALSTVSGWNFWTPFPGVNGPSNPGLIQTMNELTGTITFSEAVIDPYIAFTSLGNTIQYGPGEGVMYTFDQAFTVVADNTTNPAYFGTGFYTVEGNSITGREFSGILKFSGTYTSLSFTQKGAENWTGMTVGMDRLASSTVPEPSTYALMGAGLLALGVVARRRQRA